MRYTDIKTQFKLVTPGRIVKVGYRVDRHHKMNRYYLHGPHNMEEYTINFKLGDVIPVEILKDIQSKTDLDIYAIFPNRSNAGYFQQFLKDDSIVIFEDDPEEIK